MSQVDRLDALDWESLLPRLRLYAQKIHGQSGMSRRPGMPTPDDLVYDAVDAAYSGRRTWPEDLPAFVFFCGAIRGIASNALTRHYAVPAGDTREPSGPDLGDPPAFLHAQIRDCLDDHPTLLSVAERLMEDPTAKASDLAAMMSLPVQRMYRLLNATRQRLRDCFAADGGDLAPPAS